MKVIEFNEGYGGRIALALGFFDSVHIGHRRVIDAAARFAGAAGAETALITFRNDPRAACGCGEGLVLTYPERLAKLEAAGVQVVISARFDAAFASLAPEAFLQRLTERFTLVGAACGADYRFGAGAAGDAAYLKAALAAGGVPLSVVDFCTEGGDKVSTSGIAKLLREGKLTEANKLLGAPFPLSGSVVGGYRVGRTLGFPTANIAYPAEKVLLAPAVYLTETEADGKSYPSISNVGSRPTFGDDELKVETYLDGYSGDLYGKEITVRVLEHLRDNIRFRDANELSAQLAQDKLALKKRREP